MSNLSVALKALFGNLDYYTPNQYELAIKRAVIIALDENDEAWLADMQSVITNNVTQLANINVQLLAAGFDTSTLDFTPQVWDGPPTPSEL